MNSYDIKEICTLAAELIHAEIQYQHGFNLSYAYLVTTGHACVALKRASQMLLGFDFASDKLLQDFSFYFEPEYSGDKRAWWDEDDPDLNAEARILALLLLPEILVSDKTLVQ